MLFSLSRAKVIHRSWLGSFAITCGCVLEAHALRLQLAVRRADVLDLVVENRGRVLELGLLRHVEHQAHAAAIEEAELRAGVEQVPHAEHVAIEVDGARQIADGDGDLADLVQGDHGSSPARGNFVSYANYVRQSSKAMSKDALPDLAQQLHSVAIHLLRRLRRSDDQMGLSGPRASALSVLVFGGPASLAQLAKAEQVKPPTMARLVDALEAAGLARRASGQERPARGANPRDRQRPQAPPRRPRPPPPPTHPAARRRDAPPNGRP